jgi:hypothetical protein
VGIYCYVDTSPTVSQSVALGTISDDAPELRYHTSTR